jgi:DNA-binding response OmpR family regulator
MKTILIIEDSHVLRENLAEMLRAEGYNALEAADGQIGYDLAVQEIPDLIITDLNLPLLQGTEVIKLLREKPATAAIPVVITTAKADLTTLIEELDFIREDILIKPFMVQELLDRLQHYLSD